MKGSIVHEIDGRRYRATTVKRDIPTPYGTGYISVSTTRWELLPEVTNQMKLFS